jgi:hypothetical protein
MVAIINGTISLSSRRFQKFCLQPYFTKNQIRTQCKVERPNVIFKGEQETVLRDAHFWPQPDQGTTLGLILLDLS